MRDAVKLAQSLIAVHVDGVTDDGVWGPRTEAAWRSLSQEVRDYINSRVMALEDISAEMISEKYRSQAKRPTNGRNAVSATAAPAKQAVNAPVLTGAKQTASPPVKVGYSQVMLVSQAEAISYGNEVDRIFGLPSGTCAFILNLEAYKAGSAYDAAYKGGSGNAYWGLGQFDNRGESWRVAANVARRYGVSLRAFSDAWYDWKQSILAIGAYAAHHKSQLTAWKMPVTKEALYACHQQGSGWYRNAKRGTKLAGAQSRVSVAVINTALGQRYANMNGPTA